MYITIYNNMYITTTIIVIVVIFIMALAFPVSRHDNSLHVVFFLVSSITPDLQVDRRESTVEIYPPIYV